MRRDRIARTLGALAAGAALLALPLAGCAEPARDEEAAEAATEQDALGMEWFAGAWTVTDGGPWSLRVETFRSDGTCTVYDDLNTIEQEYACSYSNGTMTRVSLDGEVVQVLKIEQGEDSFTAHVESGPDAGMTLQYTRYFQL